MKYQLFVAIFVAVYIPVRYGIRLLRKLFNGRK